MYGKMININSVFKLIKRLTGPQCMKNLGRYLVNEASESTSNVRAAKHVSYAMHQCSIRIHWYKESHFLS